VRSVEPSVAKRPTRPARTARPARHHLPGRNRLRGVPAATPDPPPATTAATAPPPRRTKACADAAALKAASGRPRQPRRARGGQGGPAIRPAEPFRARLETLKARLRRPVEQPDRRARQRHPGSFQATVTARSTRQPARRPPQGSSDDAGTDRPLLEQAHLQEVDKDLPVATPQTRASAGSPRLADLRRWPSGSRKKPRTSQSLDHRGVEETARPRAPQGLVAAWQSGTRMVISWLTVPGSTGSAKVTSACPRSVRRRDQQQPGSQEAQHHGRAAVGTVHLGASTSR
jgi:hypothetical protein